MKKLTKIVATIGPASDSIERITALIEAGVNVFRFNMKHNTIEWHEERIDRVQSIADTLHTPIGILIDLQGPEIRLETFEKKDVVVAKGEQTLFTPSFLPNTASVCIPQQVVFEALHEGDAFLIDDGFIEGTVTKVDSIGVWVTWKEDAVIKHRKGVNFPGKHINLASLIEDDLRKLDMASRNKVDFVALSFTRTKEDVEILRGEMNKRHVKGMIIAKIESQPALDHFDEILAAADGIMVARGDLGIETPIEELAHVQKHMVLKCRAARKPVIVATQMLQSMTDNPRPTRAEATDVANAVYDLTDTTMLSQETASGNFPEKAVATMTRIIAANERYTESHWTDADKPQLTDSMVHALMPLLTEEELHIDAIVVVTKTGYSARCISSCRPHMPIVAISNDQRTIEALTLSYGVVPVYMQLVDGKVTPVIDVLTQLKALGHVKSGQHIIMVYGSTFDVPGFNNSVTITDIP